MGLKFTDGANVESRGGKLHLFAGSHGQNSAEATFRGNEDIKADSISSLRVLFIPKPEDTAVIERPAFVGTTERK